MVQRRRAGCSGARQIGDPAGYDQSGQTRAAFCWREGPAASGMARFSEREDLYSWRLRSWDGARPAEPVDCSRPSRECVSGTRPRVLAARIPPPFPRATFNSRGGNNSEYSHPARRTDKRHPTHGIHRAGPVVRIGVIRTPSTREKKTWERSEQRVQRSAK